MSGPTPESLARAGTEHANQVALFCQCALHFEQYPELQLLFAIPNGGLRDKIVAANLKAEGVKSGVCDLFLPVARRGCHGFFLELKVGKNKPTPDQMKFIMAMQVQGYAAWWFVGWEDAWKALVQYLSK